jgi:hypothetical protein
MHFAFHIGAGFQAELLAQGYSNRGRFLNHHILLGIGESLLHLINPADILDLAKRAADQALSAVDAKIMIDFVFLSQQSADGAGGTYGRAMVTGFTIAGYINDALDYCCTHILPPFDEVL